MNTTNATTTTTKRKSPPRTTTSSESSSSTASSSIQKKMRIMNENQQKVMATTTSTTISSCPEYPQNLNHGSVQPLSARMLISPSSCSLSSDNSSSTSSRCASPDTITTSVLPVVAVPLCDQPKATTQRKEQPRNHQHHHVITPQSSNLIYDIAELEVPLLQDSKMSTNSVSTKDTAKSKPASSSWSIRWKIMTFLAVLVCYRIPETSTTTTRPGLNSVCVDGGGFSGFWFTLGRLHSLAHPLDQHYYCYSAGCLGVVAALSNYSKDEMLDMALDKQHRWKAGTLNRHDIVGAFLDDLIHGTGNTAEISDDNNSNQTTSRSSSKLLERVQQDSRFLSSLHIITSQRRREKGGFVPGMQVSIRTPTSVPELREMLLQTTWIPFAVGSGFFYKDHMDGAFTLTQHPACARRVGLALDFNLLMNAVNVNLPGIMAEQFWMAGLEYGL